ncbi:hypothetical protein [Nocardioides mangrovi]|uniref:Ribosomally synthesized peptide with SipW-like signal peptide n=1 Tax=Nocardioides mangrovi TaxID=2874580 RepID=A0ABS7UBU2_9ACTN|nr:hypothetical protein [Nocardioides mangrovi]MBZ5738474.1 hypothetical protein [Nocardioides mangrovi]
MRTTTARRTITKILATVALVGGAASVAGVGTFGAYTDTTDAGASVDSGTVGVLMNSAANSTGVTASKMVPGDSIVFPVTIQLAPNSVQLGGLDLTTTITNNNALTQALRLTVDNCDKPWVVNGNAMTCPGTTTNLSTNGPLGDNGPTSGWGQTSSWLPTINSGKAVYIRATLTLPSSTSGSSTQGLSTGVTWTLTGTQRTGTTTVVTPTAS